LDIGLGVASFAITTLHSVVIKKSLDVIKGSTMNLSWCTNLLSAMVVIPLIILANDGPAILDLIFELAERIPPAEGSVSELQILYGESVITGKLWRIHRLSSMTLEREMMDYGLQEADAAIAGAFIRVCWPGLG